MNSIKFSHGEHNVSLDLRPPITVITGDTSSGKTLVWNWLKLQAQLPENFLRYENCLFVNHETRAIDFMQLTDKFIFIDNGDLVFLQNKKLPALIRRNDGNNQYLILCRGEYDLGVSPNHYATIREADRNFTLEYEFDVAGWY